jgi:predicted pyridoxine 5'-phosphate oxidase superfamily flavin-nucleotide-binding protein
MKSFAGIAFTPAVRALQQAHGSRDAYARLPAELPDGSGLGEPEVAFLHGADTFFLASVNADGWPYVQHRGGPRGFVRVLSATTLAFADFLGNRQFVSAGNVAGNDRVAIIFMDYANRRRLKLLGRLRFLDYPIADPALRAAVALPHYRARTERIAVVDIEAYDWNCPQHITPRFTAEEVEAAAQSLRARIAQLETEIAELRALRSAIE